MAAVGIDATLSAPAPPVVSPVAGGAGNSSGTGIAGRSYFGIMVQPASVTAAANAVALIASPLLERP